MKWMRCSYSRRISICRNSVTRKKRGGVPVPAGMRCHATSFCQQSRGHQIELVAINLETGSPGSQHVLDPIRARAIHRDKEVAVVNGMGVEGCSVNLPGRSAHMRQHRPDAPLEFPSVEYS